MCGNVMHFSFRNVHSFDFDSVTKPHLISKFAVQNAI